MTGLLAWPPRLPGQRPCLARRAARLRRRMRPGRRRRPLRDRVSRERRASDAHWRRHPDRPVLEARPPGGRGLDDRRGRRGRGDRTLALARCPRGAGVDHRRASRLAVPRPRRARLRRGQRGSRRNADALPGTRRARARRFRGTALAAAYRWGGDAVRRRRDRRPRRGSVRARTRLRRRAAARGRPARGRRDRACRDTCRSAWAAPEWQAARSPRISAHGVSDGMRAVSAGIAFGAAEAATAVAVGGLGAAFLALPTLGRWVARVPEPPVAVLTAEARRAPRRPRP